MEPRSHRERLLGLLLSACLLPWCAGCTRNAGEVAAAEPRSEPAAALEADPRELVTPSAQEARHEEPAGGASATAPGQPASLSAVIALLEDPAGASLVVDDAEVEVLFGKPDDIGAVGPYADHRLLDLVGDEREELVIAISGGWWGSFLHLCVFTREEDGRWRLALRGSGGSCRGLPSLEVASAGGRRWLQVGVHDAWGTGSGSSSTLLFEPVGERLERVLAAPSSGWLSHEGNALELEYRTLSFGVRAAAGGAEAQLVLRAQGTGNAQLEGQLDAEVEVALRYEQARPGARFALADPAVPAVDDDHLMAALEVDWLERNGELAHEVTRSGSPAAKLWLRRLVEGVDARGSAGEARGLLALLPSADVLEGLIRAEQEGSD